MSNQRDRQVQAMLLDTSLERWVINRCPKYNRNYRNMPEAYLESEESFPFNGLSVDV